MRIRIEINGHQHYSDMECELIQHCQTAGRFDRQFIQVPAVVVMTDDGYIKTIALKQEYYEVNVKVIPEIPKPIVFSMPEVSQANQKRVTLTVTGHLSPCPLAHFSYEYGSGQDIPECTCRGKK